MSWATLGIVSLVCLAVGAIAEGVYGPVGSFLWESQLTAFSTSLLCVAPVSIVLSCVFIRDRVSPDASSQLASRAPDLNVLKLLGIFGAGAVFALAISWILNAFVGLNPFIVVPSLRTPLLLFVAALAALIFLKLRRPHLFREAARCALCGTFFGAVGAIAVATARIEPTAIWFYFVLLFGATVGTGELIARYRDAPEQAVITVPGVVYIIVNGIAAVGAYGIIVIFNWNFGADAGASDLQKGIVRVLVAGFGSMTFFRSSLFTYKVGKTDVSIGPGVLLQIMLAAADRAVDRIRAGPRSKQVRQIMESVSFEKAKIALPNYCAEAMQNIQDGELQSLRDAIDKLDRTNELGDAQKSLTLGLMLMNVVGPSVLAQAVEVLGATIKGVNMNAEIVIMLPKFTDRFTEIGKAVVDMCVQSVSLTERDAVRKQSADEFAAIETMNALDAAKYYILFLAMQRIVGIILLKNVLSQIAREIAVLPLGSDGKTAEQIKQNASQPEKHGGARGATDKQDQGGVGSPPALTVVDGPGLQKQNEEKS